VAVLGDIVYARPVRSVGSHGEVDINYLRRQHEPVDREKLPSGETLLGKPARMPETDVAPNDIRGRDLLNGVTQRDRSDQARFAEALAEPVQQICEP